MQLSDGNQEDVTTQTSAEETLVSQLGSIAVPVLQGLAPAVLYAAQPSGFLGDEAAPLCLQSLASLLCVIVCCDGEWFHLREEAPKFIITRLSSKNVQHVHAEHSPAAIAAAAP